MAGRIHVGFQATCAYETPPRRQPARGGLSALADRYATTGPSVSAERALAVCFATSLSLQHQISAGRLQSIGRRASATLPCTTLAGMTAPGTRAVMCRNPLMSPDRSGRDLATEIRHLS